MSVLPTTAQMKLKPVGMASYEHRANAEKEETVLLDEDFSLFTAGTEDEPDSKTCQTISRARFLHATPRLPDGPARP